MQRFDDQDQSDYEPYVTEEEADYGFWFFGDLDAIKIEDSSSEDKFQRVVLSCDKLDKGERWWKKNLERLNLDESPWKVSSIHATSSYTVMTLEGIKDRFVLFTHFVRWEVILLDELFDEESRNGVEFNRILSASETELIFEMSNKSLYSFSKQPFRKRMEWTNLNVNSDEVEKISSSVHSAGFVIVKTDEPYKLYLKKKDIETMDIMQTSFYVGKVFSTCRHIIIDGMNRYFELDDEELKYVYTPFENYSTIKQIVGGYDFNIALLENGTLWASGSDETVLQRNQETYYQINISLPNIESINAFGSYGVISTPIYHLFFGKLPVSIIEKMKLKRYGISCSDLHNLNIIETESKYLTVEGSTNLIYVYRKTNNQFLFSKRYLNLFKSRLIHTLHTTVYCDILFDFF